MPVRNFYIEADIDGRKHKLTGGPGNKEGGFLLRVYMRDEGEKFIPVVIKGRAVGKDLELDVDVNGRLVNTIRRKR